MVGDINFAETIRELPESGNLSDVSLGFGFYVILIILVNLGLINLMVMNLKLLCKIIKYLPILQYFKLYN